MTIRIPVADDDADVRRLVTSKMSQEGDGHSRRSAHPFGVMPVPHPPITVVP